MLSSQAREQISHLIKTKDSIIKAIVDLDLQILTHIDQLKNETIQKLNSLQSSRRTLTAYRSPLEKVEQAENSGIIDKEA